MYSHRVSRHSARKRQAETYDCSDPGTVEAKAQLSALARRVRQQHERITLKRNGEPEAVLLSVDDLEGLEMTLEILGDSAAVARIGESLSALGRLAAGGRPAGDGRALPDPSSDIRAAGDPIASRSPSPPRS